MPDDQPFDPIATSRAILRTARTASLATLDPSGGPFASLVAVASMPDGRPVLHLSDLALHTGNLKRDARASLLLVAPGGEGGNPLAGARITLRGRLTMSDAPEAARRYTARHRATAAFADFHHYVFDPAAVHLVAGFGRIMAIEPADLLLDLAASTDLLAGETMIVDHMNSDHADAVGLYATKLLGLPAGDWRITSCDPEGIDMTSPEGAGRLVFPSLAATVSEAGAHLKAFAKAARSR